MSHSPCNAPIGWQTAKFGHCYQTIMPLRSTGMYLNLHKNLNPQLRDHYSQKLLDEYNENIRSCMKILQRQRPPPKIFTAQAPSDAKHAHAVGMRLHSRMDPLFQPAEAKGRPVSAPPAMNIVRGKPLYSPQELLTMIRKLANGQDVSAIEEKIHRSRRRYFPADEVQKFVEQIIEQQDNSQSDSYAIHRPLSCRARAHSVTGRISRDIRACERQRTAAEVDGTTERMKQYDPDRQPPESMKSTRAASAPPTSTRPRGKRLTDQQMAQVVDRLNKYDTERWPPESKYQSHDAGE